MSEDLGMLYLPTLSLMVKVYEDPKGKFVRLPNSKKKHYFEAEEKSCNKTNMEKEQ